MLKTLAVVCVLAGCATDDDSSQPIYTRTIVHLGAGEPEVTVEPITAADQRTELDDQPSDLANAKFIAGTSSCWGASLWVWDQANETGNELCLIGTGSASLASFTRGYCSGWYCFSGNWSGQVRSYWPFVHGSFGEWVGEFWYSQTFDRGYIVDSANWIAASATTVSM